MLKYTRARLSPFGIIPILWVQMGSAFGATPVSPRARVADWSAIVADFRRIESAAQLPVGTLQLERPQFGEDGSRHFARVHCIGPSQVQIEVTAGPTEWGATAYYALQKLGFLFPHPRRQISPSLNQILTQCGASYEWRPRLKFRGFHLHTMHPSEWTEGFLNGQTPLAEDFVRWSARNSQNVLQVVLLKTMDRKKNFPKLRSLFELGHELGIVSGISVSFALQQQKAFRLLDFQFPLQLGIIAAGLGDDALIRRTIRKLDRALGADYFTIEMGTSEFTSTNPRQTLEWIRVAEEELQKLGRWSFYKVHTSINQMIDGYGNFNFLPQYAAPTVGVLPHTVMMYGLESPLAPVYGRKDFADMAQFMIEQNKIRPTWYYPETSYFIGMDIDVPILLTDYLVNRSRDFDFLVENQVPGQVNFSTGQELGYWLMDWTVALLANEDYAGDPLVAIKLLGEDASVWQRIVQFQTRYFQDGQLIQMLSSANLQDELPVFNEMVHDRVIFRRLAKDAKLAATQAGELAQAVSEAPDVEAVRDPELRSLLRTTWLRLKHAWHLRMALAQPKGSRERLMEVDLATSVRGQAQAEMDFVVQNFNRYPSANIFSQGRNLTSYRFGYGWTAAKLHYWRREEEMIRRNRYGAFFMAVVNPLDIIF